MNIKVIYHVMGRLIYALAISLMVPMLAALLWDEPWHAFAMSVAICFVIGALLTKAGKATNDKLSLREGVAITGLSWFVASSIAAVPYYLGTDMGIIDCMFEGVSGITGNGASVIKDLNLVPSSILLWRSISHWLGGLGIVVIFIALFPQPGSGTMHMFYAETTGPTSDRVMPRIKSTADALLILYIALTLLLIAILILCGIPIEDAVNNGMSAISTGGFSSRNGSIGELNSLSAEIAIIIFMLIGGGNFGLYFMVWRKGFSSLLKNTEFKVYIILAVVICMLITINLTLAQGYSPNSSLRMAAFQTASVLTTTGFTTADFDTWPTFSKLCILLLMFTGGCAGSTSGGIKISRFIMLFKMIYAVIKQKLHPRSIIHVKMDGREQSETVVLRVARFFFLYIMLALIIGTILAVDGVPVMDAIGIGISTMGNAGVAFGIASSSFGTLPDISKLTCCLFMIVGRLEIFTLLAMLQPQFWRSGNW